MSGLAAVATLSGGDEARFQVSANARVEQFIPHGPVLDRATCAVTHGGRGATQKALTAACRCVPSPSGAINSKSRGGSRWPGRDHSCPHRTCARTACEPKVREAMTMSEGAKRILEAFAAAGGPDAAADAFGACLRTGKIPQKPPA